MYELLHHHTVCQARSPKDQCKPNDRANARRPVIGAMSASLEVPWHERPTALAKARRAALDIRLDPCFMLQPRAKPVPAMDSHLHECRLTSARFNVRSLGISHGAASKLHLNV